MNFYLLDGVGAGFILVLFGLGLVFTILAILTEAVVMQKMKYHSGYQMAFIQSLAANLVSLAAGFILFNSDSALFGLANAAGFAIMFGITFLLESVVLYLMNKAVPLRRTLAVSLVMNLVTYTIAVLLILLLNA